ncbi:glutathione-disulfide reductase [Stenotrophomonas sp. W1S232]|jgi:Pyruvate/2-oxoglutarate dehydrogenase complex, dihydrolipoamide dehydrogenase (E3) component, and related enzymes|uniref:Glutathione-disulfide reductase n=1 Tax=Stenotrophomonas koreensis TaxID=266128 RepID=A0A7W3UZS4_9GAMM|nr:glutathione-disulfide reductase [Stenotrophomonas koreensis]MBB1116889.1 glutathione-disulfide reductase [Stenotrophomonas koreensis]
MSNDTYDLVVLGAGSGGLAAAIRAAGHGARVAILEPAAIGGTCVNLGCVPKKIMWEAAQLASHLPRARALGLEVPLQPALDWGQLVKARQAHIARIHASYQRQFAQVQLSVQGCRGQLLGAGRVATDDGRQLQARHILLATGARPRLPVFPGSHWLHSSDDVFAWQQRPQRVAIIGGGYIAVELAGLLQALGSQVHLLVRGNVLLNGFDSELAQALAAAMAAQGITLHFGVTVQGLDGQPGALQLRGKDLPDGHFDAVIAATGREPNVQGLGLEQAGVALDRRGFIATDDNSLATTAEGVWAVGDVTGQLALTPLAVAQGRRLADGLFGRGAGPAINPELVPSVVFSHPPLARVGLDEACARERFGPVQVYRANFRSLEEGAGGGQQRHLFKVICAGNEQRVVGVHLLGEGSDEILQGFAVALQCGARWEHFRQTLPIHPTAAEEVVLAK